jgi:hypothetical protein
VLSQWGQQAVVPAVKVVWTHQRSDQAKPRVTELGTSQVAARAPVEEPPVTTQKAALVPITVETPAWLAEQIERVAGENLVPWGSIGSHSLPSMINVYIIYSSLYPFNLLLFLLAYAYF